MFVVDSNFKKVVATLQMWGLPIPIVNTPNARDCVTEHCRYLGAVLLLLAMDSRRSLANVKRRLLDYVATGAHVHHTVSRQCLNRISYIGARTHVRLGQQIGSDRRSETVQRGKPLNYFQEQGGNRPYLTIRDTWPTHPRELPEHRPS